MEKEKKKLNLKIIIPIVAAIVIVAVVGIVLLVNYSNNRIWNYIDKGEFEQAYKVAKNNEQKNSVIKANAIAYVASLTTDYLDVNMENSDLTIKDAWYDKDKNIVLHIRNFVKDTEIYVYYAYSESNKNYDMVCLFTQPITIDSIILEDKYTSGIKNSSTSKAVQEIAIATLKQKLPEKLKGIMREVNITDYLLSGYVKLDKDIELLKETE